MMIRITSLLIAAVVAGLFWSLGSNVHAIVAHLIAPPLFAIAVIFLFRTASWRRQLFLLIIVLTVAEFVRLVAYSVAADGWHYISTDGETQLTTLISFVLQCVIGLLVWTVAGLLIRRYEK